MYIIFNFNYCPDNFETQFSWFFFLFCFLCYQTVRTFFFFSSFLNDHGKRDMSVYSLIKCRNNVQILTRSLHTSLTRDTFMIDTYFYDMRVIPSLDAGRKLNITKFREKNRSARAMFHYIYIEIYFARKLIVNIIRKTGNENPIIDERVDPLT